MDLTGPNSKKKSGKLPPAPPAKKKPYMPPPPLKHSRVSDVKDSKKSPSLESRLNSVTSEFICDIPDVRLTDLIQSASNEQVKFESRMAFKRHMTEGALLNVNTFASSYLGLPYGEYMVFNINSDRAILVPVGRDDDLVESEARFEIASSRLVQHWDKLERCLAEDNRGSKEMIQRQRSKYPRNRQMHGAVEASGKSQEEIAADLNVDPSTVSRWGIDHKDGGRKPSLDHAVALSKATGQDVASLFGSVVDVNAAPRRKSTSGSGGGRNPTFRGQSNFGGKGK